MGKQKAGLGGSAPGPHAVAQLQEPANDASAGRPVEPGICWPTSLEIIGAFVGSSAVHLLQLVPTLVTLQIYDRVLTSRRGETLVMLLAAAALSLAAWWAADTSRVRWHAARATGMEEHLTRALVPLMLHVPAPQVGATSQQLWRDIASLRGFVGGPVLLAVIDLPWCLVYLFVITAFHPLLGAVTLAGMLMLVGLASLTEWRLRSVAASAEQAHMQAQRRTGELAAFAEVMQAHGQHDQVGAALGAVMGDASSARLAAELPGCSLKTLGKLVRQGLQLVMLATGAWLVLGGQATGGVMIAGSILLGKALMPLEILIGGWKQQIEARKALLRLRQALASRARAASLLPETILPPCKGELRVAQLGVGPGRGEAGVLHDLAVNSALGIVTHEADHSNRQPLYDEAYKLSTTTAQNYRPDLTGAARVAASVDLTMKAEVAGWYADLNTLRAEVAIGHVSAGQYKAYTREGTIDAKLIAIELQGKAQGLTGNALAEYVADHGKEAIPVSYATRYTDNYTPTGVDKIEVRGILAYALDHPNQLKDFTEEVGPDGTYVTSASYNNGERITTIYDARPDRYSETREVMVDGHYRLVSEHSVSSYNSDGSFGDESTIQYFAGGAVWQVTEIDGARDSADYAMRTTIGSRYQTDLDEDGSKAWVRIDSAYDTWGRQDSANEFMDDGSTTSRDYDQAGARSDSVWTTHADAQGRVDWVHVAQDDGSTNWTDYDELGLYGVDRWESRTDAQGRVDWVDTVLHDGSCYKSDYDETGSQAWSHVESRFDAAGRQDYADIYLDDGGRDQVDYDQDGSQGWRAAVSHSDASGRPTFADVYLDDGSRDWFDYDEAGSFGWNTVVSHFDAAGREDFADMYMDDGSRNAYDYDQDGSRNWARVETRFGAWGGQDFCTRYFDDGSRFFVDFDHYGLGKHELLGYDAFGRCIFFGEQLKGAVAPVFGTWNPAWGEGLAVQAVMPGGGGGPPVNAPLPLPLPHYDPSPAWDLEVEVRYPG